MYEVVNGGCTHMAILEEALKAKYQGVGKPYEKAEFDKWFANYDVRISLTSPNAFYLVFFFSLIHNSSRLKLLTTKTGRP
jgi:hypothetical protein